MSILGPRQPRQHGPTVVPYDGLLHRPADYMRYQPIDLDANNKAALDQWCARNPGKPRPKLGWGVCRSGAGLQPGEGMTEDEATAEAKRLNDAMVIGVG